MRGGTITWDEFTRDVSDAFTNVRITKPFYLAMCILFTIYSLDLIFLVVVSMIAKGHEARQQAKQADARKAESQGGKHASPLTSVLAADLSGLRAASMTAAGASAQHIVTSTGFLSSEVEYSGSYGEVRVCPPSKLVTDETSNSSTPRRTSSGRARSLSQLPEFAMGVEQFYPKVMIQLPMFNEIAVCDLIIQRCCRIKWPRDRLLIQVLDDSTKEEVRKKVDQAAHQACNEGHPVKVLRRTNREGYKAGAMVVGLQSVEQEGYEYVAIFDADFEPPADFLLETVFHLTKNPALGFVQTRWVFGGTDTLLTWAQKVNLNFHFEIEQRARSYLGWFFNFNGTAGIWRIKTIYKSGGWQSDTVVEDMDLSLRAYLAGWQAMYLNHVHNMNEVPSTISSYKTQQFRWLSGPMQILLKSYRTIWCARDISFGRKLNCYWFFTRYILFAAVTLCVLVIPPMQLFVEHWQWTWEQIWFMIVINMALVVYLYTTPLSVPYLLFSIVIGYFKTWAMLSGLSGSKKSHSWKVTQKYGGSAVRMTWHKPYLLEFTISLYYFAFCGLLMFQHDWYFGGYCGIMAFSFLTVSFGDYLL